ncbi:MAG: PD40 domain-containing protein, partial [Bacteroidia bacterium]|nr:PD40 domain-containing protein [Bacteroidia bacterium]
MKNLVYIIIIIISSGCKTPIYQLAYGTDRDNEIDICITDSENTEIKNLTNSNFTEYNFTWSSDGKKIYYTSYEDDGRKIKRIEVESKLIQTLIQDTVIQSVSDVSKDETQLIISTKDHHQKGEFYIYNIVSDSKIRLTNNELYEAGAKFSPDESTIVASIQTQAGDSIYRSGIAEIFTIDINDFSKNQLTNLKGFNA